MNLTTNRPPHRLGNAPASRAAAILLAALAATAPLAVPAAAGTIGSGSHDGVHAIGGAAGAIGFCGVFSDCAEDVPMTGTAYPGFNELDIAMRQFLKFRCGGAGVLAVSLDGRRIYKRGFGRMAGAAYDDNPYCTPPPGPIASDPVAPDTPLPLGSVSKLITASRVRELVWDRVVERGRDDVYADPSEALLLDPYLDLLPPELLEAFGGPNCGGIVVDDVPGCTRACGPFGPDVRWQEVTVGDLIAHTSGLPRSAPSWFDVVVPNYGWLRGYTYREDWEADEADVHAAHPEFFGEMEELREALAADLGLEADQELFFLSRYDPSSANPIDEWMKVIAGRCLQSDPGGSTDTLGTQGEWEYSNTGYAILDRVVSHLSPSGRYGAETGFPEQHTGSEMDVFLRDVLGIDGGVATQEGWFHWQRVAGVSLYDDPVPQGRAWSPEGAYPLAADLKRPYCVWDPDEGFCDLDYWRFSADKPRWDFSGTSPVAFSKASEALNIGQGAAAAEAPVLLRMINAYAVGNDDVHQGRQRDECAEDCGGVQLKNGALGGGYAWAGSLAGGKRGLNLPALDLHGRITADFDHAASVTVREKPGVDFVVALNQSQDENCDGDDCAAYYGKLQSIVRYALSRTDWSAVEHHLATEPLRIADIAMDSDNRTLYVYENDTVEIRGGSPRDHYGEVEPGDTEPLRLPSTRTGVDVVGVGRGNGLMTIAWYSDGRASGGSYDDFDNGTWAYSLPPGKEPTDIAAMAMDSFDRVHTWYVDGGYSLGTPHDLDAFGFFSHYALPPGEAVEDIVGIAIAGGYQNRVFVRYADGAVSEGTPQVLDAYSWRPPLYTGMLMTGAGTTVVWFETGHVQVWEGTPRDNVGSRTVLQAGWVRLPEGRSFGDIRGIDATPFGGTMIWFDGGGRATGTDGLVFGDYPGLATLPPAESWDDLLGVAVSPQGDTYSWFRTGKRARGTASDLDATYHKDFTAAAGYQPDDVAAVAIDPISGNVFALYRDGAASEGRSWNLDAYGLTTP